MSRFLQQAQKENQQAPPKEIIRRHRQLEVSFQGGAVGHYFALFIDFLPQAHLTTAAHTQATQQRTQPYFYTAKGHQVLQARPTPGDGGGNGPAQPEA
jgi:hypothetical protein